MFPGTRRGTEGVLYFIITLVCLERVRVKYNALERIGSKGDWSPKKLKQKRAGLMFKASMMYGLLFCLLFINLPISLIERITSVYPDTMILKTNSALWITIAVTYFLSILFSMILLSQYIKKMNGWKDFWKILGRSAFDGTKEVIMKPVEAGGVVLDKMKEGTKSGIETAADLGAKGKEFFDKTSDTIKDKFQKNNDDE